MGIFTRFRDIVSSNINALLDRAEDPEKMVRLMIQEMEDTLIEIKSNCAGMMAEEKKLGRALEASRADAVGWEDKARLAMSKGREDLARAALVEKQRHVRRAQGLEEEVGRVREAVETCRAEIAQLEAKLVDARDKQRSIIQRRAAAQARATSQGHIRRVDTSEAFAKFEAYENGIDRLHAEADLTNSLRPKEGLRDQFAALEHEDEIERELEKLRKSAGGGGNVV
ncbi:MAG: phage shock protein PspA [bacterium]|nr:phage shock protein PspA [bacterium]